MPCAYGAPVYIVSNVGINAWLIDCFPHLCLHLLYPIVCSVQVSKGVVDEFWENADLASLQENNGL